MTIPSLSPDRLRQLLHVEAPLMNAPTPVCSRPAIVAAVCRAGGLGVVDATLMTPAELERFVAEVRSTVEGPLAIALRIPKRRVELDAEDLGALAEGMRPYCEPLGVDPAAVLADVPTFEEELERFDVLFEKAVSLEPVAMISLSGGFREPEEERLEELGIANLGVATTLLEGKVLRTAGADAVIVQGSEAGGERLAFESAEAEKSSLMNLVPQVVRATGLPVIAWGGVATPEQAGALAVLGAEGAVLENVLLASEESTLPAMLKNFIVSGSLKNTVLASGFHGREGRFLKTAFSADLPTEQFPPCAALELIMRAITRAAWEKGVFQLMEVPVGEEVGSVVPSDTASVIKAFA